MADRQVGVAVTRHLVDVMSWCHESDVAVAMRVSQGWNEELRKNELWVQLCKSRHGVVAKPASFGSWRDWFRMIANKSDLGSSPQDLLAVVKDQGERVVQLDKSLANAVDTIRQLCDGQRAHATPAPPCSTRGTPKIYHQGGQQAEEERDGISITASGEVCIEDDRATFVDASYDEDFVVRRLSSSPTATAVLSPCRVKLPAGSRASSEPSLAKLREIRLTPDRAMRPPPCLGTPPTSADRGSAAAAAAAPAGGAMENTFCLGDDDGIIAQRVLEATTPSPKVVRVEAGDSEEGSEEGVPEETESEPAGAGCVGEAGEAAPAVRDTTPPAAHPVPAVGIRAASPQSRALTGRLSRHLAAPAGAPAGSTAAAAPGPASHSPTLPPVVMAPPPEELTQAHGAVEHHRAVVAAEGAESVPPGEMAEQYEAPAGYMDRDVHESYPGYPENASYPMHLESNDDVVAYCVDQLKFLLEVERPNISRHLHSVAHRVAREASQLMWMYNHQASITKKAKSGLRVVQEKYHKQVVKHMAVCSRLEESRRWVKKLKEAIAENKVSMLPVHNERLKARIREEEVAREEHDRFLQQRMQLYTELQECTDKVVALEQAMSDLHSRHELDLQAAVDRARASALQEARDAVHAPLLAEVGCDGEGEGEGEAAALRDGSESPPRAPARPTYEELLSQNEALRANADGMQALLQNVYINNQELKTRCTRESKSVEELVGQLQTLQQMYHHLVEERQQERYQWEQYEEKWVQHEEKYILQINALQRALQQHQQHQQQQQQQQQRSRSRQEVVQP